MQASISLVLVGTCPYHKKNSPTKYCTMLPRPLNMDPEHHFFLQTLLQGLE